MTKTEVAQQMVHAGCNQEQIEAVLDCKIEVSSTVDILLKSKNKIWHTFGKSAISRKNIEKFTNGEEK